jgi:hypothetical protein
MQVLITYDVNKLHKDVKSAMKAKGYYDYWTSNGIAYYLPNTTLWKQNTTSDTAISDIKEITTVLGVRLERAVAVNWDNGNWSAIPGIPHVE